MALCVLKKDGKVLGHKYEGGIDYGGWTGYSPGSFYKHWLDIQEYLYQEYPEKSVPRLCIFVSRESAEDHNQYHNYDAEVVELFTLGD